MKRLALVLLLALPCVGQTLLSVHPDLVVVISIDQFRYEYIQRFAPYFGKGGFNRFLKDGASFTQARYPYATTYTGPGHAAIGTGYTPSRSGIVANTWYDRLDHHPVYCVDDPRVAGKFSPLNLASDSLGDRVQEKYPGAKVIGVSIKDRAAILMAGRKATAAYWFDPALPGFITSSYYTPDAALLASYNATVPPFVAAHTAWTQSPFIPSGDLPHLTHDPARLRNVKGEHAGLGTSFPHPIAGAEAIEYTPFGNEIILGFARRLLETENVGTADGAPDLLFISLSPQDYLGHDYGPDSLEVADAVVRLDRQLADFLGFLERNYGGHVVVALTADHGVQSIPEVARDMGRDAGRVGMGQPAKGAKTFADLPAARRELELRAAKILSVPVSAKTPLANALIDYFEEPSLYLNWSRIHALKLDGERVKRAIRDAARTLPGVSAAYTNSELQSMPPAAPPLEQMLYRSFRADRSGDVLVTLKRGWIWNYSSGKGTTHGQPVEEDQHVPVMLWGAGITRGTYEQPAAPTDLAKTIGALLGVEAGGPDTQVLPCVKAR
jgi:Type I phosphodiesterase / nucleotide pyrophosphatase